MLPGLQTVARASGVHTLTLKGTFVEQRLDRDVFWTCRTSPTSLPYIWRTPFARSGRCEAGYLRYVPTCRRFAGLRAVRLEGRQRLLRPDFARASEKRDLVNFVKSRLGLGTEELLAGGDSYLRREHRLFSRSAAAVRELAHRKGSTAMSGVHPVGGTTFPGHSALTPITYQGAPLHVNAVCRPRELSQRALWGRSLPLRAASRAGLPP